MARPKKYPPEQLTPTRKQMLTLLGPYQVATLLGLTTRRVVQMIRSGEIFAKRIGDGGWAITQKEAMRVYRARRGGA